MTLPNVVFLVGFAIFVGLRGVYKARTAGNEIVARRMDAVELTLLIMLMPGAFLLPVFYLSTSWLSFADYRLPPPLSIIGGLVMVASLCLFWRSHADLGQNFSQTLELRKGHTLITRGVYRSIRHPMYASLWLWFLAQGLLLTNWLAGWYGLLAFGVMYFVRVPREEAMMREFFGEEYLNYAQHSGRIFPRSFGSAP